MQKGINQTNDDLCFRRDPEKCATKFFGIRDLSDHRWVAFLLPHIGQLRYISRRSNHSFHEYHSRLILLEKTTLGTVNTGVNKVEIINARDAVFVAVSYLRTSDDSYAIFL